MFLTDARRILDEVNHAKTVASQVQNGYLGELFFGFIESALWDIMPTLIPTYHEKYPQVKIIPRHMNSVRQMPLLERGELQAGIVDNQFDTPGIAYHLLREESFVLALPAWHPLAGRERVHVRELRQEKFVAIRRDSGPFYFDFLIKTYMENGFSPDIVLYTEELLPLLSFVACGMGVALVQESARHIRGDLCYLTVDGVSSPAYRLSLAWNEEHMTKTLQNFIAESKQLYPQPSCEKSEYPRR